jgi:predicted dehydrogenase
MPQVVRVGFVGAGGIANSHLKEQMGVPDIKVAAVTDASREAAEAMAGKTGASVWDSPAEMVKGEQLDALFLFLPPFAHGEAERVAIEHKIPFFIEKPVGLDSGLMREIAAEVERQNLLTSAGYMNRYRKGVNRVRELLDKDPAILGLGGWWGGTPGRHPWWIDRTKSGGQFHEQVTHTVDLARYFFGEADEVFAVAARGFNKDLPGYSMDDAAAVTIKFKGGGIASLMASVSSNAGGRIFLDIHSLKHNFHFTEWDHRLVIKTKGEEEKVDGEPNIFAIEDAAFIEAVRTGDRSGIRSTYADAVKSAELSLAANQSIDSGKPVEL